MIGPPAANADLRIAFRRGTHRIEAPTATFARIWPMARRMGVTRVGAITGLDRVGIPVAIAVRPDSRSISVALGKGLTLAQARTAALMEAVENFHAEEIFARTRRASFREISRAEPVLDPATLCRASHPFDPDRPIRWIEGVDLLQGGPCWVPAELVHTNYTLPRAAEEGLFQVGSNGLASGNHPFEAIGAALCELVERDAVARWKAKGVAARAAHLLDRAKIDDVDCLMLLRAFENAAMAVRLWDVTTEIGLSTFACDIRPLPKSDTPLRRRFRGAACHPDRNIALAGALMEAAQVRLTYISGGRDDLDPEDYVDPASAEFSEALLDIFAQQAAPRAFAAAPHCAADELGAVLQWQCDRLREAGIQNAVIVDLTRPEFGIPVFRAIVPGLAGIGDDPSCARSTREREIA